MYGYTGVKIAAAAHTGFCNGDVQSSKGRQGFGFYRGGHVAGPLFPRCDAVLHIEAHKPNVDRQNKSFVDSVGLIGAGRGELLLN